MTNTRRPRRGFSRREFMQAAAAAGGTMLSTPTLALNPRGKKPPSTHPDPDLILRDGRIHTMDAKNRVVSSVAIKDGRFIEVGNVGRHHFGRETKVIDLDGRTVVPGIIDNHNHLVLMGNRPGYHTPLENAHSIADALAIIGARAARVPAGRLDHHDRRVPLQPSLRQPRGQDDRPLSDPGRARHRGAEQPGVAVDQLQRPLGDQHRRPEHPQRAVDRQRDDHRGRRRRDRGRGRAIHAGAALPAPDAAQCGRSAGARRSTP